MNFFRNLFPGFLLLLLPILSYAQVLDFIDVRLVLLEKVENTTRALPKAKLSVSDQGEMRITNDQGICSFTYSVRKNVDTEISVSLISEEHKMLKPINGVLPLDTSREEMLVELLVVNLFEESPEFKERIQNLEAGIARLQSENKLTGRQLNAINNTVADTLIYFEAERKKLENEREKLNEQRDNYQKSAEEQKKEIEAQKTKMTRLQERVDRLAIEIEELLEERYLRQNEYFKGISRNLKEYVQRAKDIRDELEYFSPGNYRGYTSRLNFYQNVFAELNTKHPDYTQGVEKYWETETLSRELEEVFGFLLKIIHHKLIAPTVSEINTEIRKQRHAKAQKIAKTRRQSVADNLEVLEKIGQ